MPRARRFCATNPAPWRMSLSRSRGERCMGEEARYASGGEAQEGGRLAVHESEGGSRVTRSSHLRRLQREVTTDPQPLLAYRACGLAPRACNRDTAERVAMPRVLDGVQTPRSRTNTPLLSEARRPASALSL